MYLHCPTCRLTVHREKALRAGEAALCPRCADHGAHVVMRSEPRRFFRGTGAIGTTTVPPARFGTPGTATRTGSGTVRPRVPAA